MPRPGFGRSRGGRNNHGGGRDRGRERSGGWGSRNRVPSGERQDRPKPPPGLRGRALGLFYRDRMRNKKAEEDQSIKFEIPPSVSNRVRTLLKEITKVAEKNNIITTASQLKSVCQSEEPNLQKLDDTQDSPMESEDLIPLNSKKTEIFKKPFLPNQQQAGSSSSADYIPVKSEDTSIEYVSHNRLLALRGGGDFKYGYNDIITESFQQKLDYCLSKGIPITSSSGEVQMHNEVLLQEYNSMVNTKKYNSMLEFRRKLPAYQKSADILDKINKNQVVVISGETGCGKSTQVPQIILDDAILNRKGGNVKIVVTQPRRIAASSLAERVAEERAEMLGQSVGYAVRLEKVDVRQRGSITFCTTGIMLADLEVNQGLTNVSHIILDEVHERDSHVDLTMCMLKRILKKRKDLKLILMSATLDAESLSAYFDNCPCLHIEGLAYPVKDIYLEEILKLTKFRLTTQIVEKFRHPRKKEQDMLNDMAYKHEVGPWLDSIRRTIDKEVYKTLLDSSIEELIPELLLEVIMYISKGDPGAILVFLPGIADITKLLKLLEESNKFPRSRFDIYPLHSKLASLEQRKIFQRPPQGVRKIILATNIAETSITIDDIVYVVDSGKIKISGLNVEDNVATLKTEWVSQANLRQRRGRAGRCQPGVCYHVLTSFRASKLAEKLPPELQRSNLLEPVLMIKKLRLGKADEALNTVLDPPALSTVRWAVRHLQQCGALDSNEVLTPLGWHLARLPLHPAAGKLLLFGSLFGCLNRAASVAAVWGFKDPFMMVIGKEAQTDRAKRELSMNEPSDHIAIAEAIMEWESTDARSKRQFAFDYFLSPSTLELLSEMKKQLGNNLKEMGFLTTGNVKAQWENRNENNLSLFKAIVAAALYPNVANVKWMGLNSRNPNKRLRIIARTPEEGRVEIHPSSVMATSHRSGPGDRPNFNNPGANWLVYWLKQRSTKLFLIEVTLVYTLPILFFGELIVSDVPNCPEDCFISISTIKVRCLRQTAELLFEMRALLDQVLASKVMVTNDNAVKHSQFDDRVLDAVIELITAEDVAVDYDDDDDDSDYSDTDSRNRNWN